MFIRTKDGIYELSDGLGQIPKEVQIALMTNDYKQSDNLVELCDGFYIQINDWNFEATQLFDNLENAIKDFEDWKSYSDRKHLDYEISIYAFIKTGKGLIYVAKMDNEGKLVLI